VSVSLDNLTPNLDACGERFESSQGHCATCLLPTLPPERLIKLGGIDAMYPDANACDIDRVTIDDIGGAGNAVDLPAEKRHPKDLEHGFSERVVGQTQISRLLAS
jgi:hypothetical protein